ncbi:hypothetical protein BGZ96_005646, partial [Linnemannia gamsii]
LHRKLVNHLKETDVLGLPEDEVARWMFQVLEAFIYLQEEKNLVHRDLKPENIVLDGEGNVKVIDFGLAFYLGVKRAKAGSQGYWAPEVEVSKKIRKGIDKADEDHKDETNKRLALSFLRSCLRLSSSILSKRSMCTWLDTSHWKPKYSADELFP